MSKEIKVGGSRRITIKAVADEQCKSTNACDCCSFMEHNSVCGLSPFVKERFGLECSSKHRKDGNNVHFKLSNHWK